MKAIKDEVIILTPSDTKTNRYISFSLGRAVKALVISFGYEPKYLQDQERTQRLIRENIQRDAGDHIWEYKDYSKFKPLKNLITLSLDSPEGYVGAAHRQANTQRHIISEKEASEGFEAVRLTEGQWRLALNIHSVITDKVECRIKIEAEEEE